MVVRIQEILMAEEEVEVEEEIEEEGVEVGVVFINNLKPVLDFQDINRTIKIKKINTNMETINISIKLNKKMVK